MSDHSLSFIQRLVRRFTSTRGFDRLESESRLWKVICRRCGHSRDIWEIGGIRARAAGISSTLMRCPSCSERNWHQIRRDDVQPGKTTNAP